LGNTGNVYRISDIKYYRVGTEFPSSMPTLIYGKSYSYCCWLKNVNSLTAPGSFGFGFAGGDYKLFITDIDGNILKNLTGSGNDVAYYLTNNW